MKFIKKLLSHTWFGHFVAMCKSIHYFLKDYDNVSDFFYGDTLKNLLKRYLNIDFKTDWIGRLYGVINPAVDIDGNFNPSNMIIELDGNETNNNEYVKVWVYKQLNIVGELFKIHDLYNYIVLEFKHVGPPEYDNYLLVFDLLARQEMAKSIKTFLVHTLILGIIAAFVIFSVMKWFPNLLS